MRVKEQMQKSKTKLLGVVVLLLAMSVGLLTGCTPEGNSYYQLSKEASQMEAYSFTADMQMSMDMDALVTAVSGKEMTAEDKEAMDMIKDMKISYNGVYNAKDFSMQATMNIKMGDKKAVPVEMRVKGANILINVEDFIDLMEATGLDKAEVDKTREAFKGVEWLNYSDMAGMKEFSAVLNSVDFVKVTQFMYDAMDYLNENSFKDYKPAIFSKKGNGYEMTIAKDKVPAVTKEFITYVLTNSDNIVKDITALVDKIDDSAFTALNLKKADVKAAIANLPDELGNFSAAELKELDGIIDEVAALLNGSEMTSYIAKTGDKKYEQTMTMKLAIADPDDANIKFGMTVSMDMKMDGNNVPAVQYPTSGIKSISEVALNFKPTATNVSINLNTGMGYWFKTYDVALLSSSGAGKYTLKEVDGYNYLPMRQIAELLGEEVGWSDQQNKPFVVRDGKNTMLDNAVVDNGVSYVRLRDFEKLGYKIQFDEATNTATVARTVEAAK